MKKQQYTIAEMETIIAGLMKSNREKDDAITSLSHQLVQAMRFKEQTTDHSANHASGMRSYPLGMVAR